MTEQTNNTQIQDTDNYKGFSLFNDIEDVALRTRNRAVVMANIAESNSRERKISAGGMGLIIGYFDKVPKTERKEVMTKFIQAMKERGYELTVTA